MLRQSHRPTTIPTRTSGKSKTSVSSIRPPRSLIPFNSTALSASSVPKRSFFTIIDQYEKGVTFTLGKLTAVKEPGIRLWIPFVQSIIKYDMRWLFLELKHQDVVTLDNITIKVDAVVQWRCMDAGMAACQVRDCRNSVQELAAVLLREILSESELNEILHNRNKMSEQIRDRTLKTVSGWGLDIRAVNIKDISFDQSMVRSLARKAEAVRDREAKLIAADAEVQVAGKFLEAAKIFSSDPTALELRRLETLLNMSREKGNTMVVVPSDLITSFGKRTEQLIEKIAS